MIHIGQISANMSSPAVQVTVVVAGCLVLYVAFKIGFVILKNSIGSGWSRVAGRRKVLVRFRNGLLTRLR
jgi:hypothetical protein